MVIFCRFVSRLRCVFFSTRAASRFLSSRTSAIKSSICAWQAVQPPPSGTVPVTPSTGTRRSLVAAKVYLSGMLELQRDPEAAHHRGRLQARLDDEALLEALADAYRFLEGRVAPTLAGRIRDRLFEALPHAPLRRMQALLDARADAFLS